MSPAPEAWVEAVLDGWRRGQARSAVGPGPVDDHLDHARRLAAAIGALLPRPGQALDLGSGVGIPGLALAGLLPDTRWTLLDASQRRVRLVAAVVEELGWADRVEVIHQRAEDAARSARWAHRFDLVTARLFGPPAVTAECGAPFLAPGGALVVTEPPGVERPERRWPATGLAPLGLEPGPAGLDPPLQVLLATGDAEARFPRQPGVARRRPLW